IRWFTVWAASGVERVAVAIRNGTIARSRCFIADHTGSLLDPHANLDVRALEARIAHLFTIAEQAVVAVTVLRAKLWWVAGTPAPPPKARGATPACPPPLSFLLF